MRIPGLRIAPLLLALWAAPAVAQMSNFTHDPAPTAAPSPFAQYLSLGADAKAKLPTLNLKGLNIFSSPNAALPGSGLQSDVLKQALQAALPQLAASAPDANTEAARSALQRMMTRKVLEAQAQRCYTVREYQFSQADSGSDVTTFKDYTACEPASGVRLKGATLGR
jgi:hypothetical protein